MSHEFPSQHNEDTKTAQDITARLRQHGIEDFEVRIVSDDRKPWSDRMSIHVDTQYQLGTIEHALNEFLSHHNLTAAIQRDEETNVSVITFVNS